MKTQTMIILFAIMNATLAQAAIYKLASQQGHVTFAAKGKPALMTIKGQGEGVAAQLVEKNALLNGMISFQLTFRERAINLNDTVTASLRHFLVFTGDQRYI